MTDCKCEKYKNMLEDVVNELDLSDYMIETHGPVGTPPAELVGLVLERKDMEIRALKSGMIETDKTIERYRHFKGGYYEVVCQGVLESDPDNADAVMVVYRCIKTGKVWIRPAYEFFGYKDGKRRFIPEKQA